MSKKAGFFDNDTTSYMAYVRTNRLDNAPSQSEIIFEGKDEVYDGALRLYFNDTKKSVELYSIDPQGKLTEIGHANCFNATPWDDLL